MATTPSGPRIWGSACRIRCTRPSLIHPLMPLFGLVSPATARAPRSTCARRAGRMPARGCSPEHLGVEALDRRPSAAATWILATPALNYALADLWPSHFYGWSLFPWMVLCPAPSSTTPDLANRGDGVDAWPGRWDSSRPVGHLRPGADPRPADGVDVCARAAAHDCAGCPRCWRPPPIGACIAAPAVVRLLQEMPALPRCARATRWRLPVGCARAGGPRASSPARSRLRRADGSLDWASTARSSPSSAGRCSCWRWPQLAGVRGSSRYHQGLAAAFCRLVHRAVLAPGAGSRADLGQLRLPGSA